MIPAVDVWLQLEGQPRIVGVAYFSLRRGRVSTNFKYDEGWLASPGAFALEPAMPLGGRSFAFDGLPGCFQDSSPDRWGRHLVARRELAKVRDQGVSPHILDDVDFMLGVHDDARQGALRFCARGEGDFLSSVGGVPPLLELPRLLHMSDAVARNASDFAAVKALLDAGSGSLGGARPKASVSSEGRLLLAKFPHAHDEWDVMSWEKTALDLAEKSGIDVSASRLVSAGSRHVLLLNRFDRGNGGEGRLTMSSERIHYISGMTLMGSSDGAQSDYLEVAEALGQVSSNPSADLTELFRRIVFSIAINNTDDHLRNIGLLYNGGWRLSPLFDVNPNPDPSATRVTAICCEVGQSEASSLAEYVDFFGLEKSTARAIVEEVVGTVSGMCRIARSNACPESEIGLFQPVIDEKTTLLRAAFGL